MVVDYDRKKYWPKESLERRERAIEKAKVEADGKKKGGEGMKEKDPEDDALPGIEKLKM